MNTNVNNILPIEVRNCNILCTIQMFFSFIDRRHSEMSHVACSIESVEDYLSEIQHYDDMCTKYTHLHSSVVIANRYYSVAQLMIKQMKGEF